MNEQRSCGGERRGRGKCYGTRRTINRPSGTIGLGRSSDWAEVKPVGGRGGRPGGCGLLTRARTTTGPCIPEASRKAVSGAGEPPAQRRAAREVGVITPHPRGVAPLGGTQTGNRGPQNSSGGRRQLTIKPPPPLPIDNAGVIPIPQRCNQREEELRNRGLQASEAAILDLERGDPRRQGPLTWLGEEKLLGAPLALLPSSILSAAPASPAEKK
ncbi:hypothetical protein NDU88_002070 [Pleurodeles waltl]|uniref:Uncharacterized protein n=1 Tax=Pleurodeles waltl TaxID=8319 RepID=A0AAV7UA82_PLEWA|nr:hypothetical protein NDU88_002070 [Pleurodeles waltl]